MVLIASIFCRSPQNVSLAGKGGGNLRTFLDIWELATKNRWLQFTRGLDLGRSVCMGKFVHEACE